VPELASGYVVDVDLRHGIKREGAGADPRNLAKRGTGMVGNISTIAWVFAVCCCGSWASRYAWSNVRSPLGACARRMPSWPTAAQSSYSSQNQRPQQFTPSAYDYDPEATVPAAGSDHLGQSRRLATQDPSRSTAPPRPQPSSMTDELERLSRLRDSGHVNEQECAALKGRLLP
jgi:hypothetical protein